MQTGSCESDQNEVGFNDFDVGNHIMSIHPLNTTYDTTEKGSKRGTDWDRYVHVTKQS